MVSSRNPWIQTILRAVVVAGTGIGIGYYLYGSFIFMPHYVASQFAESSITSGIAYAALRSTNRRNAPAALLVWYIVYISRLSTSGFYYWTFILTFAYVAGIGCAMLLYDTFSRKPFAGSRIRRIALAGIFTATLNSLIVVALLLIRFIFWHHLLTVTPNHSTLSDITHNFGLGAWIGTATGIGMEIAEYLNNPLKPDRKGNSPSLVGANRCGH